MKETLPSWRSKSKRLLACAMLSIFTTMTEAAYYPGFRQPFDFSLLLANNNLDLQTGSNEYDVSLDRLSIEIFTLIKPQIQLGLISGSSNLSLGNDPVSAGKSLNGYHAGLAIRSVLGHNPQIGFHANYIYQETKNEAADQTITLDWHEWAAGISGKILVSQQLELSLGWRYHDVDVRHRATGNTHQTQSLKLSGSQGRLEVVWLDHSDGRVSLAIQRGSYQQIEIRFLRKFR